MTIILLLVISFAASFVGTLAGSGGLIGMPSLLLIGLPIHQVIGSVKFSNMFSSFSSFYILLKKKQLKLKDALQLIPFALFGGFFGGLLANSSLKGDEYIGHLSFDCRFDHEFHKKTETFR